MDPPANALTWTRGRLRSVKQHICLWRLTSLALVFAGLRLFQDVFGLWRLVSLSLSLW
ncbi:hypothetical protein B0H12DRAFT_1148153 [Mycena haematopus]|nr:hypothetical protein B0H12DRAFT_1148153 [Mycena haematopus]